MSESIRCPEEVARAGPVLVTGANGFLGANLVWALREQGLAVRALVRRPARGPQWEGLHPVEFVRGDIRDPATLAEAMKGASYVIHAAALTELIPRPRRLSFRVNVDGARNVCETALKAGIRRLVFTSSVATMGIGTAERPATEDTPIDRDGIRAPYYTSKQQAEQTVKEYVHRGLESIILCPTYVLGPRDGHPTTNQLLLYLSQRRWACVPPGGMNVVDVREAARAHVRALWLGQPGTRYLLAGPYCAYAELGAIVRRILGQGESVFVMPRWTYWAGSLVLALASGILPRLPNGLSLPNFQYGFVPFHVSGARGDRTFHLQHPPVPLTVLETLRWFQQTGQAPWLQGRVLSWPPTDELKG